jgi:hypothetical protein
MDEIYKSMLKASDTVASNNLEISEQIDQIKQKIKRREGDDINELEL